MSLVEDIQRLQLLPRRARYWASLGGGYGLLIIYVLRVYSLDLLRNERGVGWIGLYYGLLAANLLLRGIQGRLCTEVL